MELCGKIVDLRNRIEVSALITIFKDKRVLNIDKSMCRDTTIISLYQHNLTSSSWLVAVIRYAIYCPLRVCPLAALPKPDPLQISHHRRKEWSKEGLPSPLPGLPYVFICGKTRVK